MQASLRHVGNDLLCEAPGASPAECRIDGEAFLPRLLEWASRYDEAVRRHDDDALALLGRDLYDGLDASGWASAWAAGAGPRRIEIRVADPELALARALLDVPWELLASACGFFVDDESQCFEVTRRIGAPVAPVVPRHADLELMFMAAVPGGAAELAFEAEEAAILDATAKLPLHIVVEESGAAAPLAERLALDEGPFEMLHLSCHGDIDPVQGPYLAFEDEAGRLAPVLPAEVAQLLGDVDRTPLVFLSACRTAEHAPGAAARPVEPFVRNLVRAGVHNVLGWDGSVYDNDAASFAQAFYRELALQKRVAHAAALARQQLRRLHRADPERGLHWHLARLYVGAAGGGALAAAGLPRRKLASTSHSNQFLDAERREVLVASRQAFAGRRRELQAVHRAFASGNAVLVHGMGNLGKSSLAHRVATRMTGHRTVVVFKRYDALAIFDRLVDAVEPGGRAALRASWRPAVAADEAALGDALEAMLESVFDEQPILLVIDDLESVLEAPARSDEPAMRVQAPFRVALAAVLHAFARVQTKSRLLVTSRYLFSLVDSHGVDLAAALTPVPLRPMSPGEQHKQLRAAATAARIQQADESLLQRALATAEGNPGLQTTLTTPLLAGENEVGERALAVIVAYKRSGAAPRSMEEPGIAGLAADEANALLAYFRRMAFDVYRGALTDEQALLLAVACVFAPGLPIPRSAVEAGGKACGLTAAAAALDRLLALGLLDDWGTEGTEKAVAANPLARPLAPAVGDDVAVTVAEAAVPLLAVDWRDADGEIHQDERGVELARLALSAPRSPAAVVDTAAVAAARFLFSRHEARRAHDDVLQPAWSRLAATHATPSAALARIAFDCAERLGETAIRDAAVLALAASLDGAEDFAAGSSLLRLADACETSGDLTEAQRRLEQAADRFRSAGASREFAIARGRIADILQARGQLDEATRILRDEVVVIFERTGDMRSKAVAMGRMADILQAVGQLDEALQIRSDEELPVYTHLGDVRSKAVAMGKIADILQARGRLDEALCIRREQELPVYARVGDVVQTAVAMGKVADIMQARGQLNEALRIRREEVLPVYDRLGDVREKALAMGNLAVALNASGQVDEALRMLREEVLQALERLGDGRAKAVAMGQIADILQAQGQLDEALALHEERLPLVQPYAEDVAHIRFSIAQIRLVRKDHQRGGLPAICDDLSIAFATVLRMQRPNAVGASGMLLAQALVMYGERARALEVLAHARAAFETLGDASGIEHTESLRRLIEPSPP